MASVEVNKVAPDFTLMDLNGEPFQLSTYKGNKNVLLVLNRGFVWPFCQRHMMQLHQDMEAFNSRDTIIVTIGPENAEAFKKFWAKNGYAYYGLPDENHTVLKMYGQQVKLFKFGRMPAQMLIDKNGVLRFVHFGHDMQDIPSNEEILGLIDNL